MMKLEDKLEVVKKLTDLFKRNYGTQQSVEILQALFDAEGSAEEDFAVDELQPILGLHLSYVSESDETEQSDIDTTSLLCELFAYCT
jgi:hypothetical protein|tara:strand:+ start:26399 stop:26659 length:261 start_codon:yes stop_codon:yes gene_type:complete